MCPMQRIIRYDYIIFKLTVTCNSFIYIEIPIIYIYIFQILNFTIEVITTIVQIIYLTVLMSKFIIQIL